MLEVLTQKLTGIFRSLGKKGKLTEKEVDVALREIRLALLEADVNFKVVREFLSTVRERAVETEVLQSLTSVQQIVKIVNEEMVGILGREPGQLSLSHQPSVILLVGLQGSGKTTSVVKLASHLKRRGQNSLLVAADTRRPAAVEQLKLLGEQQNIQVYSEGASAMPVTICRHALGKAKQMMADWLIVDTQGRLQTDEHIMAELSDIKDKLEPAEVLLTVDAMTGQDAVKIAQEFHQRIGLTGLILTKMDGDARGGAALSIRYVTGVPIKFMGLGEKVDDLEPFYPDRLASRILGMGDMLTLIEKADKAMDQQQLKQWQKKMNTASFDVEDTLAQLRQVKKMGSLNSLVEMLPGFSQFASRLPGDAGESQLRKVEAIILSMTPEERRNPTIINGSRRHRIAAGSGTTTKDVNQFLSQFYQIQKLTRMMKRGRLPKGMPGISFHQGHSR